MNNDSDIYLILHNIRSIHNVGSLFRTADAAGVTKIFCTGYTPTPRDRFDRKRDDLAKVALGAEEAVAWEKHDNIIPLLDELGEHEIQTVALEQIEQATDYRNYTAEGPTALILGNEVEGLPKRVTEKVDTAIEIPMYGIKKSLNVAVAAGIVLFELRRENGKS